MAINTFNKEDYLAKARSRVTMAFEDKPVFDKFLQLLVLEQNEIQEVIRQMMQDRSIDTASGRQLDIIGDIVGQPRILSEVDLMNFFGFEGHPASESYGDAQDPTVGGYWYDATEASLGSYRLTDRQYRILIKAKIVKNITRATPEDIIAFIKFVFGVSSVNVSVSRNAEAIIFVSDDMEPYEHNLLQKFTLEPYRSYFVPKTLGIGITFSTIPSGGFFSFLGVSGGMGYGSLGEPGGGAYATL